MIYLDNASTTLPDSSLINFSRRLYSRVFGNASSSHRVGRDASKEIEKAREIIAGSLNAHADEIYFTSGGTESNNIAIWGRFLASKKINPNIIISSVEHPSVYNVAQFLKRMGVEVRILPVDSGCSVIVDELTKLISSDTILVSVMQVNNETGIIQPIRKIGSICREREVPFHSDACQGFTKEPFDVKKDLVDIASISSHKIHGLKGTAALYLKRGVKLANPFQGGGQELGLRPGTPDPIGIAAFAFASTIYKPEDYKKVQNLRDYFMNNLIKYPAISLNGSASNRISNNINIRIKGLTAADAARELSRRGVMVSTGSACSSSKSEPSRVLISMGLSEKAALESLRITLSVHTEKKEIDLVSDHIFDIMKKLL